MPKIITIPALVAIFMKGGGGVRVRKEAKSIFGRKRLKKGLIYDTCNTIIGYIGSKEF